MFMQFKSPLYSTRATRVFVTSAIIIIAFFAFALFLGFSSRVQAVSTNVVISEFRVRGPNGAADEFIELYNLSGAPVAIGGWKIRASNATAGGSDRATKNARNLNQPGLPYFITKSSTSGGAYSGALPRDQTVSRRITNDGGIPVTPSY